MRFLHASLIATISACAVGSLVEVTWLLHFPIISPSLTITHQKGHQALLVIFSVASVIAARIKSGLYVIVNY